MTDEAKALAEREGMQVLLPPASIDGDYLMGWLEGQSYLIANYGTDEAFDQAIAVANKVHKLQDLIETQAREIERLNAILSEMNDTDVIARTMAENKRLREALADPHKVHLNMLAGHIAKPSPKQILHIYGADAFRAALAGDSHDQ